MNDRDTATPGIVRTCAALTRDTWLEFLDAKSLWLVLAAIALLFVVALTIRVEPLPAARTYLDLAARALSTDPGERTNLAADHPDRVAAMRALLDEAIARGRTTPGPDQANDVPITVVKPRPAAKRPPARPKQPDAARKAAAVDAIGRPVGA